MIKTMIGRRYGEAKNFYFASRRGGKSHEEGVVRKARRDGRRHEEEGASWRKKQQGVTSEIEEGVK